MMKKLVAFFLSICLIMGLMIPAMAEDAPFLGDWHLRTISDDEENSVDLQTLGLVVDMTLNADNTATMIGMSDDGEPSEGTWALDENGNVVVIMNDEPAAGVYNAEDDTITLSAEGQNMFFTREAIVQQQFAEVNKDVAKEDFNGSWKCAYIHYNELVTAIDGETEGIMPVISINDGVCTMTGGTLDISGTDENGENLPVEMVFEDGGLAVSDKVDEETNVSMAMNILQDGMLKFTIVIGDFAMDLYYVRADA